MLKLPSRRILLPFVLLLAGGILASMAVARGGGGSPRDVIEVDGPMPAVDAPALGGGRVRTADFEGTITVVNFWASWCAPCRREQPMLERLSHELRQEVRFLGVNFRDDEAAALEYLDEFGVTYPSVTDRDGLLAYRFGVPYLPATVLVDRTGEMRFRLAGEITETTLLRPLSELLDEA